MRGDGEGVLARFTLRVSEIAASAAARFVLCTSEIAPAAQ